MPRSCTGPPSSAKTGRSIQAKSGTNPVHQITFATSRSRPSSSTGRPPRAPVVLGTRSIPAAVMSFGLTRASGRPREWNFCRTIRPVGVLTVSTCETMNQITGMSSRSPPASAAGGFLAGVPPRQPGPAIPGHLQGDLGPRVGGAYDQDAALLQLGWIPVFAGMQLDDARIELAGEGGDPGALVRPMPPRRGRPRTGGPRPPRRTGPPPWRARPRGRRFEQGDRIWPRRPPGSRPPRPWSGTTRQARGRASPAPRRSAGVNRRSESHRLRQASQGRRRSPGCSCRRRRDGAPAPHARSARPPLRAPPSATTPPPARPRAPRPTAGRPDTPHPAPSRCYPCRPAPGRRA